MARIVSSLLISLFFYASVWAVPMSLKVTAGKALVWKQETNGWTTVADSTILSFGDSVYVDVNEEVAITVGNEAKVLLKGIGRLALSGQDLDLTFNLIEGQMFLSREKPYELNFIAASARNCKFIPIGTAGAIKFTKVGEPTVAMLEGKMRVEAPTGQSTLIGPGQYATFTIENTFKEGTLPPQTVSSLENWSGQKMAKADGSAQTQTAQAEPASAVTPATPAEPAEQPAEPASAGSEQASQTPSRQSEESTTQTAMAEPEETPAEQPAESEQEQASEPQKRSSRSSSSDASTEGNGGTMTMAQATSGGDGDGTSDEDMPAEETGSEGDEGQSAGDNEGTDAEGGSTKPTWGLSAGPVTVDGEQWTRIAFFGDIPIWKFGLGIDVELFMNSEGQFDKKGWDFTKDNWLESITRKIVYIRFQREQDPLFIKFGGLSSVTLGYGFVMDRFTNMLHYPDEKLLGMQFYINDVSPIGITFQAVVADFLDFQDDGGIIAGRFGLRPMKFTEKPIISGLKIAATYAHDIDQYASGRRWENIFNEDDFDKDFDDMVDRDRMISPGGFPADSVDSLIARGYPIDTHYVNPEIEQADTSKNGFGVLGFDISVPIISSKILNLDVYGQFAMSMDDDDPSDEVDNVKQEGWGIGAPGVYLGAGPLWARVEYRRTQGYFTPGYFGPYYLDKRIYRYPTVSIAEMRLVDETLNGVYGELGFNISGVLILDGAYQYLVPQSDGIDPDHRFELNLNIGEKIITKIPKISKVEGFLYKTNIGSYDEAFFEKTPSMYWGYRLGFEIMPGAGIVWEARYGWKYDLNGKLKSDDNIGIQASMTF